MDNQAPATIPDLAEALTHIPIQAIDVNFLLKCSNAQLEEFLTHVNGCTQILTSKKEMAHGLLEFRGKCIDKARRLRALPKDEAETLLAACPTEEAAEVRKAMDALANPPTDAPATQHLMGSVIESDSVVPPGEPAQLGQ